MTDLKEILLYMKEKGWVSLSGEYVTISNRHDELIRFHYPSIEKGTFGYIILTGILAEKVEAKYPVEEYEIEIYKKLSRGKTKYMLRVWVDEDISQVACFNADGESMFHMYYLACKSLYGEGEK